MSLRIALALLLLLAPAALRAQVRSSGQVRSTGQAFSIGRTDGIGFLSAPSGRDAAQIAREHLRARHAQRGLPRDDLDELRVRDRYETRRTGTTHLYLQQQVDGIDVLGGHVTLAVDRDGRVITRGAGVVRDLRRRIGSRVPMLSAGEAVASAAAHLGLDSVVPALRRTLGGASREAVFAPGGMSADEIPAKLVYVPQANGNIRLAWNVVIRLLDGMHWWNLYVDATSGVVLRKNDWIAADSYRVFPLPSPNPDLGTHSLVVDPSDVDASPFGWHDTNGAAGAEFTDTRGNNVYAQEDDDANNTGGERPDGGAGLDFDFAFDPSVQPGNNRDASVTNLFYWNNVLHDIMYQYGFDEAAGNFQENNYGGGGLAGDPVQADALDGSSINNANFATPPDGQNPRMQMFRFEHPTVTPELQILSPPAIAAELDKIGTAVFGGGTLSLTGSVVQAVPNDACAVLTNPGAIAGNIALIDRGTCLFVEKVAAAQAAGAIGVIIVNNQGNLTTVNMAGYDPTLVIPPVFIGKSDGSAIEAQLGGGVTAELITPANRDSDFDNMLVIHEYGHGISNRLTGGPSNVSCLHNAQSAGMGEGWGDWWSLVLTAEPGDEGIDSIGAGTYAEFQSPTGPGIRNYPYSTDLGVNPLTYADIATLNQPHGVGEVWAISLWEMYWNFVDVYGFDSDLYAGTGGNNLALQLVMDALKLQDCNPTFLNARQQVLTADFNETGGANECLIWSAFAKRGLGVVATDGGGSGSVSVVEDFSVPAECVANCGDGLLQLGELCDDGGNAWFDGCAPTCEPETIFPLYGLAAGGTIDLEIEGVMLQITTVQGETAAEVAANVAAAIDADLTLAGLGVTAAVDGSRVATNGNPASIEVNDAGLSAQPIPALPGHARWWLMAIMGITVQRVARTRVRAVQSFRSADSSS